VTSGDDGGPRRAGARGSEDGRRRGRGASGRREHLVRLAAELFAAKGYQATTVRDIADEAGILSGSLYHHFDSKESIADEILTSFFADLTAAIRAAVDGGGDPRTVLAELVRVCFDTLVPHRAAVLVWQNDWHYLRRLERFDHLSRAEEETERIWVGQITDGQRAGVLRDDLDPRLTYRMIRDAIWVAVRWFQPGGRFGAQDLADHYITVLFDGVAAR
jgi:TetR/AcrR family transcriptional regulator, cholesterol catabolism regulator